MTPEEKYRLLYEGMYELCNQQGWGDPFSYARSREIYMAGLLGHTIAESYSGEDAKDQDGGAEYKSTIGKNISGTYNGISVQETWEEQERYLKEDKIGKYPNHYFARYDGPKIVEVWKLNCEDVLSIILPKIKKQFEKNQNITKKDPRLGATISKKEIQSRGKRIV